MMRILALAALLAGASAATFLFGGAGSASAPEPAKLATRLSTSTPAVDAVYAHSGTPTRVLYFNSAWVVIGTSPTPEAGTPCSAWSLAADATATPVIQRYTTSSGYSIARCF